VISRNVSASYNKQLAFSFDVTDYSVGKITESQIRPLKENQHSSSRSFLVTIRGDKFTVMTFEVFLNSSSERLLLLKNT
jgi:hypothetical protein